MTDGVQGSGRGLGRVWVRLLAAVGCLLVLLAAVGWWLDTRVVDDDGFADVVAKASQQPAVRDYVADQATLRLARSSNFVSAARPLVTDAISTAIATPPAEDAIRELAGRAHHQVFSVRVARRVDIDSQQAATTIRSTLRTINPALSKKLPANVLDASATISQNAVVDLLFRISGWIWLWIPIFLLGLAALGFAVARAADRVAAVRTVGVVLAVAGALLAGFGAASPVLGSVVAPDDPGRGDALGAFVAVLTGRLTGAGLTMILLGLMVALAPGRDGGDLASRVGRLRSWVTAKRQSQGWRFAGGLGLMLLAALVLTQPADLARTVVALGALLGLYIGVVICLRAGGILVTDHGIPRLRRRWVMLVGACLVLAMVGSVAMTVTVVAATQQEPRANLTKQGCNGAFDLCVQPMNQIVWPASHNAMSSTAYNFYSAEHIIPVSEQLNAGARFLMLDVYYGYENDGIVRTNLAGGVDRKGLERERGKDAVEALDRMGALTGTADTSGRKQDLYLCHDFCELGAVKAVDVFSDIRRFLDVNLTEAVVLDFEDYVQPKDLRNALEVSGLMDRVAVATPATMRRSLEEFVSPRRAEDAEKMRRVITVSEKHGGVYRWLPATYSLFEETPYSFARIADFDCEPNRGGTGKSAFLVNHWLRPDGPPDPVEAGRVNSAKTLFARFRGCAAARGRIPNVIAVDFTTIGDFYRTVDRLNGAIARLTGVTPVVDRAITRALASGDITEAEAAEVRGLRRLPNVSAAEARRLLGTGADELRHPPLLDVLAAQNDDPIVTSTTTRPS